MEEGNRAKEGNVDSLEERANQTWKKYARQISETKAWSLPCVQNRLLCERVAGCLFEESPPDFAFLSKLYM